MYRNAAARGLGARELHVGGELVVGAAQALHGDHVGERGGDEGEQDGGDRHHDQQLDQREARAQRANPAGHRQRPQHGLLWPQLAVLSAYSSVAPFMRTASLTQLPSLAWLVPLTAVAVAS